VLGFIEVRVWLQGLWIDGGEEVPKQYFRDRQIIRRIISVVGMTKQGRW